MKDLQLLAAAAGRRRAGLTYSRHAPVTIWHPQHWPMELRFLTPLTPAFLCSRPEAARDLTQRQKRLGFRCKYMKCHKMQLIDTKAQWSWSAQTNSWPGQDPAAIHRPC